MIELLAGMVVGFAVGFVTCAVIGPLKGSDWNEPETKDD